MNSRKLLERLDAAWVAFYASYAGLSDVQMLAAGVTGAWSVRDIVAHVTAWDEEALTHLPLILQDGAPPRYSVLYGGIDAFDARMTERTRSLSLAEVRAQSAATHRRLVDFLRNAPEDQLSGQARFRRRLRLDTYGRPLPATRGGDPAMAEPARARGRVASRPGMSVGEP